MKTTRRSLMRLAGLAAGAAALQACAPAAPTPAPKPTEAPKPAAAAPTAAAKPTEASKPAAEATKPATAATPAAQSKPSADSDKPLKIGVLLPYSGVYAQLGEEMTNAMALYFEQIGNTVAGRKVELVKEDSEAKPDVGLRKARRLIEEAQVDLLTGIVSSAVALGVRDVVHNAKVPLVISNAGANDITRSRKSPYIYRVSFSNWQTCFPMGEWVFKQGHKKVFTSAPDYAAGKEDIEAFKEGFEKAGGQIVGQLWPPLGNNDFASYLTQMKNAKPDAVFSFYAGSDALRFVQQYEQFGLKADVPLYGPGFLVETDVLPQQGKAALGIKNLMHYASTLDNPENKKFVGDYSAKFKTDPSVYAAQAWDAAHLIAEAVKGADGNTTDRDRLLKSMSAVKFKSPRGPVELDPETNNVILTEYVRDVREIGGKLQHVVIDRFDKVRDPGK